MEELAANTKRGNPFCRRTSLFRYPTSNIKELETSKHGRRVR
jgi:hypothetical protein